MPKIKIINNKTKHLKEIHKIETLTYGLQGWSKKTFVKEIQNKNSISKLAVNENNNVLGYIFSWILYDEGHITNIVVDFLYRRKHIADILLYNLIASAQKHKINWLTLEVRSSNHAALNLYRKFNFKIIGIRKKYYQNNNEDALILWTENINSLVYQNVLNEIYFGILNYYTVADKYHYISKFSS